MSGAAWLRVTSSDAVRGTPISDLANLTSTAVVEATNSAGDTVRSTIVVPIRGTRAELVPDPKVMTMNMWFGGRNVSDYREKQLRFLLNQNVDVVTVQESYGTSAKELGEALCWDYYQAGYDLGIISRYPIVHRSPLPEDSGLSAMRPQLRRSSDTPVLTGDFNAASHQD